MTINEAIERLTDLQAQHGPDQPLLVDVGGCHLLPISIDEIDIDIDENGIIVWLDPDYYP